MATQEEFRDEIEAFLERHGMAPATLGSKALKDPKFVFDLRTGRSPSVKTMDKVRHWMAEYERDDTAAAPADESSPWQDKETDEAAPARPPEKAATPPANESRQAESSKATPKAQKKRSLGRRLAWGFLIIAIILVAGWITAPAVSDFLRARLPASVVERLGIESDGSSGAGLRSRIAELEESHDALSRRIDAVSNRNAQLSDRIAALSQQAAGATQQEELSRRLNMIEQRLSRIEATSEGLSPVELALRIDEMNDALADQREVLNDMDARLEQVEYYGPSRQRAIALLVAYLNLRRAIEEGQPYQDALNRINELTLQDEFANDEMYFVAALTMLEENAASGVSTEPVLIERFERVAPRALREQAVASRQSWIGKTLAGLLPVTVRQTGDIEGDDLESVVARAEIALKAGNLKGAVDVIESYSGQFPASLGAWLDDAGAVLGAQRALNDIESYTLGLFEPVGSQSNFE